MNSRFLYALFSFDVFSLVFFSFSVFSLVFFRFSFFSFDILERYCILVGLLYSEGGVEGGFAAPVEQAPQPAQPTVIPGVDSLIGDLLDIDMGPGPSMMQQQMYPPQPMAQPTSTAAGGSMDIFGEGLDNLVRSID